MDSARLREDLARSLELSRKTRTKMASAELEMAKTLLEVATVKPARVSLERAVQFALRALVATQHFVANETLERQALGTILQLAQAVRLLLSRIVRETFDRQQVQLADAAAKGSATGRGDEELTAAPRR